MAEAKTVSVHEALAAVMGDVQSVAKKDRNTMQNFNFRGIDAVMNAVGPALRKHKVIVMPSVEEWHFSTVEVGQKRTLMGHVIIKVTYRFIGPAGDYIDACVLGEAMDSGDKAVPKAMSVALRTALLQSLALPTDEPDPDESSYERATPEKDGPEQPVAKPKETDPMTDAQRRKIQVLAKALGYDADLLHGRLLIETGKNSSKELTMKEASAFIDALQKDVDAEASKAKEATGE